MTAVLILWSVASITADFKETQLERMRPGQRVTIHVDAMHQDFAGTVESMPAITGSRTSVLPTTASPTSTAS